MNTVTRNLCLAVVLLIAIPLSAFGQSTGTFNGTVMDNSGAAVPGAAVAATNIGTGLVRRTVTNGDGLYTITTLDPGVYEVKAESPGFAPSVKSGVNLIVGTTLTLDFTLNVAGTTQQVEVLSSVTTIDTTQSEATASIETDQLQNLPIINRNTTGLVQLLPGARPVTPNPTKQSMGAVTFSGGGEYGLSTVDAVVDGAENRDLNIGGPNMNYSNEAIDEFTAINHELPAEYAHGTGVVNIVTKSGTNEFHGTAFGEGRSDAFTSIDYFTKQAGLPKTPYNREQYGGNFGGPIIKGRLYFFMALERPQYNQSISIPSNVYSDMLALQTLDKLQNLPPNVLPTTSIPQTYRDWLSDAKLNFAVNDANSLFIRFAGDNSSSINDQFNQGEFSVPHDLSAPSIDENSLYSIVGGWTRIISPTKLNRFTIQRMHYKGDINSSVVGSTVSNLNFPTFSAGRTYIEQINIEDTFEAKDDFSIEHGKHALKFGGDFQYATSWGVFVYQPGYMTFFATPSAILSSYDQWLANPGGCNTATCGAYQNGLETVGAVSLILETSNVLGGGYIPHSTQWGVYAQDDWKIKPHLTLNFGLRYDISPNFYNSTTMRKSRVLPILQAIDSPYGNGVVGTPKKDIGPRFGFAWDIRGDGKHVLRGGAGIFFSQGSILNSYNASSLGQPSLFLVSVFPNTGTPGQPGSGIFSTYQYGVSPLPSIPPQPTALPPNGGTTGYWQDPQNTDPYSEQFHIGYAWQISERTSIQADFTHALGLHGLVQGQEINPIEGAWDPTDADQHIPWGTRRLEPALAAIGQPNILGSIQVATTANRDTYDELAVQFQRRFGRSTTVHVNYTYSRSYTYYDGFALQPQNQDQVISPENWGPQTNNQPNALSAFGVFNLPAGIQLSPILQVASARPYTLTEGVDLNQDGVNNDRYVPCGNPAACSAVGPDSARGKALVVLDLRGTKFFNLGKDGARKLGVYVEGFNLGNRANFGNSYNGNCSAILVNGSYQCANANFQKPDGYIPGLGYTRQMQIGARFIF
jgi:hypothetical protein